MLARACLGFASAGVRSRFAWSTHHLRQLNTAGVHGKEKVYGSIP
jgi:hypothetical protein